MGQVTDDRETVLAAVIADRLAYAYNRAPAPIAKLLDESVDRSGNLLVWLREYNRLHSARLLEPTDAPSS